jgi:hypothetical protein
VSSEISGVDDDMPDAVAGGSVTASVSDAEVAVSPEVRLLAVTVSVATGWSVPAYCDVSDSPVSAVPVVQSGMWLESGVAQSPTS